MDNLTLQKFAALNNAEWCDIICSSHNMPGVFKDNIWINCNKVPMYYPNIVTLDRNDSETQYEAFKVLMASQDSSWTVKDSFSKLDLTKLGFKKLFDAEWLLAPELSNETNDVELNIKMISTADELIEWKAAWSGRWVPFTEQLFKPTLLKDDRVRFIGVYKNNKIIAGAIANRSKKVVGLSNLFYPDNSRLYWHTFIKVINKEFSNLPIIDYEHGDDLKAAIEAGCKSIGPLTVWISDK